MKTVTVNAETLRTVLSALVGPDYMVRELQATRSLGNSPIDELVREFNRQAEETYEKEQRIANLKGNKRTDPATGNDKPLGNVITDVMVRQALSAWFKQPVGDNWSEKDKLDMRDALLTVFPNKDKVE